MAELALPPGATLVDSGAIQLPPGAKLVTGATQDKGFLRGLVDTVNPLPAIGNLIAGRNPDNGKLGGPVQGIENLVTGAIQAGKEQFHKAGQAVRGEGEFQGMTPLERGVSALGHGLAGVIPVIGPAAATAGDDIGGGKPGQGIGEAAGLIGSIAVPEMASHAVGAIPAASAEAGLRASSEAQYARVLAPTTKANKALTADVVPGLIDRGVTALTLKGLQKQAAAHISSIGAAIGDAWDNLPPDTVTKLEPIYDKLQSAIDDVHSVPDANGKMIPKGPEAERAIGNLTKLQQTLVDIAAPDPVTGDLTIPANKIRGVKQYFDDIAARAGRYSGTDLADQSMAEAHGLAADGIRKELASDHPDIAALNKEFSFWKNASQVVGDTIARKQGQSKPLGEQLARAGGFVKGGPLGAEAMGALTHAVRSPAWGTVSAVLKDNLADAIAAGNKASVEFYVRKIGQAGATAALSGPELQTALPATAPSQ